MYLHLGEKTVVSTPEIIGIFDMDTSTVGKHTRDFLAKAEKGGRVVNVSYELPKSFVLCGKTGLKSRGLLPKKGGQAAAEPYETPPVQVYISQISSSTLRKRSRSIDEIKNSRKSGCSEELLSRKALPAAGPHRISSAISRTDTIKNSRKSR